MRALHASRSPATGAPSARCCSPSTTSTRRAHYRNAYRTLRRLLDLGAVPIVNENDTVATEEIRFGDNDRLAALVAALVHADLLVLLSDVDALYTGDPRAARHRAGSTRCAARTTWPASPSARTGRAGVGTGGMVTKVEAARIATGAGIPVVLTSAPLAADGPGRRTGRHAVPPRSGSARRPACSGWPTPPRRGAGCTSTTARCRPSWAGARRCCRPASPAVDGQFAAGDPVDLVDPAGPRGRPGPGQLRRAASCPGCSAGPPGTWPPSSARRTRRRSSTATTWCCCDAGSAITRKGTLHTTEGPFLARGDGHVSVASRAAGPGGRDRAGHRQPSDQGRRAAGDGRRAAWPVPPRSWPPTPRTSTRAARPARPSTSSTGSASTRRGSRAWPTALRQVAGLPDPVGEVLRGSVLPNGLELRQLRVPLGVVGIIYEARPNVTADAAGLCLKSGNAVLLRGSSSARASNAAIVAVLRDAVAGGRAAGRRHPAGGRHLPRFGQGADAGPRPGRRADPARRGRPDPLGGRGVDGAGDRDRRGQLPRVRRRGRRPRPWRCEILLNAKTSRPSVCNAAESLLVHAAVADAFLALALPAAARGRGDRARRPGGGRGRRARRRRRACRPTEDDYAAEYLSLDLSRRGRGLAGRRDRPHQTVRLRPHRGDRHRLAGGRPAVRGRGRRRRRDGERLHPVHRRRRVRLRRRDRHLHPEAARPRARWACPS